MYFFSQDVIFFKPEPRKVANLLSLGIGLGLDPNLYSSNFVDPDPNPDTINPDPHHWYNCIRTWYSHHKEEDEKQTEQYDNMVFYYCNHYIAYNKF